MQKLGLNVEKRLFLVEAKELTGAQHKVKRFLEETTLVIFEYIEFTNKCYNGGQREFYDLIDMGISQNKKVLKEIVRELVDEGYKEIMDVLYIPQGYISKLIHTIAHILDGFIGIDTYFFNLEESSHWISKPMYQKIKKTPNNYWVLEIDTKVLKNF